MRNTDTASISVISVSKVICVKASLETSPSLEKPLDRWNAFVLVTSKGRVTRLDPNGGKIGVRIMGLNAWQLLSMKEKERERERKREKERERREREDAFIVYVDSFTPRLC